MTNPEIGNELAGIAETIAHAAGELTQLAESVAKLSTALKSADADRPVPQAPQKKAPELAEVRALLAEISRGGKRWKSGSCWKATAAKSSPRSSNVIKLVRKEADPRDRGIQKGEKE